MNKPDQLITDKFLLLSELLKCGNHIYLWKYAPDGHLVETDSPHLVLDVMFEYSGNKAYMLEHIGQYTAPLIMGTDMGLLWCAVFDKSEPTNQHLYVLGPVFNTEISSQTIEERARKNDIPLFWREGFAELMRSMPVVPIVLFFQHALTAHYLFNGEHLNRSDLHFQKRQSAFPPETDAPPKDRMQVWLKERALLNMVRDGDINYKEALHQATTISNGIHSGNKDPLLHALISVTGFTSLCVREAIHAGISPETAYTVGDNYIQSMVNARNISELSSISKAMYEDFIMRVHKHRTNPAVSPQIQACRDYIELYVEKELTLSMLAQRVGYSEYHLSRKFKQEIGVSIKTYIRYAKIERAKLLLETTVLSNAQIAEQLHFCFGSHFSTAFQEVVGQKPHQYRQTHQKI